LQCEKNDKLKGEEKGIAHGTINTAIELCTWKTEINKKDLTHKIDKGLLYIEVLKSKDTEMF